MTFIYMDTDDFEAYQNIIVTLNNFSFPPETTLQIHKALVNQRSIYHFRFNRS